MNVPADVRIETMRGVDVPAAAAIEAVSIPRPWPEEALARDVTRNPSAAYFVARGREEGVAPDGGTDRVLGFVGTWRQVDEVHVTTIAVHPAWRRRGIGRALMLRVLDHAISAGAAIVTLEVRVSNAAAQRLYAQLGFEPVGQRKGYYSDNGEDALVLSTPDLADPAWRARIAGVRR